MKRESSITDNVQDIVHHSKPIPISTQHLRHRSASISSSETSNSPASSPSLPTPLNFPTTRIPNSPSSPMFYFLSQSQSPSKTPATFPFRGLAPPPVPEGVNLVLLRADFLSKYPADDTFEDRPQRGHMRRGSVANRLQPHPSLPEPHQDRGANVLRRLSLGNHLVKPPPVDIPQADVPQTPPNSAMPISPVIKESLSHRKPRRSATVTEQARPRRAPSPMGERILKGHFDGFN